MKLFLIFFIFIWTRPGFDTIEKNRSVNKENSRDKYDTLHKVEDDSSKKQAASYLKNHQDKDIIQVNRLNKLAATYFEAKPDSTLYYGKLSVQLSRKISYQAGLASGLLQIGHAHYFKGNSTEAKKEIDEAIAIFKRLNNNKGLSDCYMVYGRMYTLLSNPNLALSYLNRSLDLKKQQKDKKDIADCYKYIGMIYFNKGQFSTALDYYYKALSFSPKNNNGASAEIYINIGDVLHNMDAYDKALEYYKKALAISISVNDQEGIGTGYEDIGEALLAEKKYDDAIFNLLRSIKIANALDDKDMISYVDADLGRCYAFKGQSELSMHYLTTSLEIASNYKILYNQTYALLSFAVGDNLRKDFKSALKYGILAQNSAVKLGNLWFRANAAIELNKAFTGLGSYKEANSQLLSYISLKDSLKDNEGLQKLTAYNLSFNFATKQQQLEQSQHEKDIIAQQKIKQQRLNIIFLAVILGMLVFALIHYSQKRKQLKINSILAEKNQEVSQQKDSLDDKTHELNALNSLKDRLIAILAHDIRAPLCTLRGIFDLLQDKTLSINEVLEMIPNVLKKLEYTSDFLDTLLSWINSQMENFENSVKSFPLKNVVDREIEMYQDQAELKHIKLINNVPDTAFAVADPNSISVVIRNLVTNALKFCKESDKIEISARLHTGQPADEDFYEVAVKDTGMGMADDQLNRLFKGKVESHAGTKNESGTGMGMMFCKDLIEKCGGKIWVTSELGKGTQFYFTIPSSNLKEEKLEIAMHEPG